VRWLDAFLGGLWRASRKFQCVLAGGDTTRRREILINVMVVGEVRAGCAVLRSGARAGDILYASGRLGEAELGLQTLRRKKGTARTDDSLTRKHLYPEPRLALGQWLAEKGLATSMIDLSDGLSSDLPRLCAASGVGARLVSAKIPLIQTSANAHKHEFDPLKLALHGGDDYELLFTVPPRRANSVPKAFKSVALTAIGTITEKQTVVLLEENGREQRLVPGGWDPFRKKP
jgi:thiamine-monophosphate kinase